MKNPYLNRKRFKERPIKFSTALELELIDVAPKTSTARNRKRRGKEPHPKVAPTVAS